MTRDREESSKQLHLTFVGMLFALAIGEVAIGTSRLVIACTEHWISITNILPAASHLILSTVVIVASWVGWRNSEFCGTHIKSVFSWNCVQLVLDLALVACYFLLARFVELPNSDTGNVVPNAGHEAWVVGVIMFIYLFWDILSHRCDLCKLKSRFWPSAVCLLLSGLAIRLLPLRSDTSVSVVFSDCVLVLLVLLFRAMKIYVTESTREEDTRKEKVNESRLLMAELFILCVVFTVLAKAMA